MRGNGAQYVVTLFFCKVRCSVTAPMVPMTRPIAMPLGLLVRIRKPKDAGHAADDTINNATDRSTNDARNRPSDTVPFMESVGEALRNACLCGKRHGERGKARTS